MATCTLNINVSYTLFTQQDKHTCWRDFDVAAMWEDLNRLSATIAAEKAAKQAAAAAAGGSAAAAAAGGDDE